MSAVLTTAIHTNTLLEVFYSTDHVLVRIASELNQPLSQFINAVDVCLVPA